MAGLPLPRVGERIVLAVDVSPWLRPDAETSAERLFCHVHGRAKGTAQMIPGWPYSIVAALQTGRSSWTAVLDAVRLGPADDATAVTAAQLREVVDRLIAAGHWRPGDPEIWIVLDSGYDVTRLAFVLADLPVRLIGRLRSDRVLAARPRPVPAPGAPAPPRPGPGAGRPGQLAHPRPHQDHRDHPLRHGAGHGMAPMHPRLARRGAWLDHPGELPIIEGTLIRLQVEHLPGDRAPKPVWLWIGDRPPPRPRSTGPGRRTCAASTSNTRSGSSSRPSAGPPRLRDPVAADRWTWLIIAAYTQLRLARDLTTDLRRPWERPCPPGRLTPARVRRGFRHLRPKIALPARAPKPSRPGPGRPPGIPNQRRAPRHDVGKTTTRARTLTAPAKRRVKRQAESLLAN